jgi:hypothetical protein
LVALRSVIGTFYGYHTVTQFVASSCRFHYAASSHCQNWKIGRSLIYFEIMSIITHHSQSRNHQKKMSKFRCQEGKVADEIVVNAMTDERKIIWSDCQACGGSDGGQHIYRNTTLDQSSIWQINQWRIRCFQMIFPEVDKLKLCPGKVGRHRIEVHFKTVGWTTNWKQLTIASRKDHSRQWNPLLLRNETEWTIVQMDQNRRTCLYKDISLEVDANFGTEFYLISKTICKKSTRTLRTPGSKWKNF